MDISQFFELVWSREIPELSTLALLYKHKQTGAEVLIMENDDENKVFSIGFRTLAANSTGVAHILEHSVLNGSRKYPLKEPFLELLKSSLQTFLNAFTFPDKTVYPVASQNTKDFYNLVDVYLDAVFHPNLTQHTFMQEGWHHEIDPETGKLSYKGVVFNEMKGAYSSPDSILSDKITFGLYPDNEYSFDQGGDPANIPDLTYAEFIKFHQKHYHPANARIFFYGNGKREAHLELLQEFLQEFSAGTPTLMPDLQPEFASARTIQATYPTSEGSVAKAYTTTNWLVHDLSDPVDRLGFEILEYMLLSSDAAPLKNALLESELGEDLAGFGYEVDFRQPIFSTGLKGVAEENVEKVEQLILDKLSELARDGISSDLVKGAVNRVEFDYRENTAGSYPKGLIFVLKALHTWLYDGDPLEEIYFDKKFQALRERLDAGERFFENLIQKKLLDNNHRLILRLTPDVQHLPNFEAAEKERLDKAEESLTAAQKSEISQVAAELEQWQKSTDTPELLAKLPSLHISDIDPAARKIPEEVSRIGAAEVFRHDLQTDGLVYLAAGFDITYIPQELLPYLSIFSESLLRLGTQRHTYEEIANRIDLDTGGIDVLTHISPVINADIGKLFLFFSGKSTLANVDKLLDLMSELILDAKLDQPDKFKQVILEEKAKMESALVSSGHSFVLNRVSAHYRQSCLMTDEMSGITYLHNLRHILELVEHDWQKVLAELTRLRELMLKQGRMIVNVTAEAHAWDRVSRKLQEFVSQFPDNHEHGLPEIKYQLLTQNEGLVIPASVNFVAQAFDMTAAGYELNGAVYLIQNLLNRDYMWNKVRVLGGAYGGFADYQIRIGVLMFASYRDPNVKETLDVYAQTPDYLLNVALDDAEIEKNIIGAIGRLDTYLEPEQKGWVAFDWYQSNTTPEIRQQIRDQLLNASVADIRSFGEKLKQAIQNGGRTAILGEREKILQAEEQLKLGLRIEPIL